MATLNNISGSKQPIEYYANDEFDLSVTITQGGSAVDLSGKTLVMEIKKDVNYQSFVYQLTTASEITVSGASDNIVTFSGTYNLDQRVYFYSLKNTTDSETLMYGTFIVTKNIV
ncbi:unnamed protein product [marine sediment metagenome]|uniref:BppU N-terminal domain-containing protein n=1 Tax=marine sediment metagenome TaxID=412755 RepID=X0T3Q3_9ZZZZ